MNLKGRKFENSRLNMEIFVYEINGKEWFVGNDMSILLGYSNYQKALQQHVWKENKKSMYVKTLENIENNPNGGTLITVNNNKLFINEVGLYQLIFGSKLAKAREFQKWVFEEVLPSIRKNNFYIDKDNISKEQANKAVEYLLDLCGCGKTSLGRASLKIFGDKSELKTRLINLGLIDFENCKFKQLEFKASNGKIYPLFVCNMSGTYENGEAKHQLQVSLTNAGYVWLKDKINENKDFGLESDRIEK